MRTFITCPKRAPSAGIRISRISLIISSLRQGFDSNIWTELTGVQENKIPANIDVRIYEYEWDLTVITKQYQKLVKTARDRLDTAIIHKDYPEIHLMNYSYWIGLSDEHLAILSPNLDIETARTYLYSL